MTNFSILSTALAAAVLAAGCSMTPAASPRWQGIGLSARQESVCARTDDSSQCARTMEEKKWSKLDRFAERKGDVLELRLSNGKVRTFEDTQGTRTAVRYSLIDFVRPADAFVVHEAGDKASHHLLVRRGDGSISKLDSAPVFSPNHDHFVTAAAPGTSHPSAIRVYRLSAQTAKAKMEWSLEPATWEPGLPRWVDDATIAVPTNARTSEQSQADRIPSELTVKQSAGGLWYAVLNFD